uniref:(northern house mosquito) hypothetical protein n=1 Tax=Culex pipiens TaxID=7175 RepID=A0A8D8EXC3_CULPI
MQRVKVVLMLGKAHVRFQRQALVIVVILFLLLIVHCGIVDTLLLKLRLLVLLQRRRHPVAAVPKSARLTAPTKHRVVAQLKVVPVGRDAPRVRRNSSRSSHLMRVKVVPQRAVIRGVHREPVVTVVDPLGRSAAISGRRWRPTHRPHHHRRNSPPPSRLTLLSNVVHVLALNLINAPIRPQINRRVATPDRRAAPHLPPILPHVVQKVPTLLKHQHVAILPVLHDLVVPRADHVFPLRQTVVRCRTRVILRLVVVHHVVVAQHLAPQRRVDRRLAVHLGLVVRAAPVRRPVVLALRHKLVVVAQVYDKVGALKSCCGSGGR